MSGYFCDMIIFIACSLYSQHIYHIFLYRITGYPTKVMYLIPRLIIVGCKLCQVVRFQSSIRNCIGCCLSLIRIRRICSIRKTRRTIKLILFRISIHTQVCFQEQILYRFIRSSYIICISYSIAAYFCFCSQRNRIFNLLETIFTCI